MRCPGGVFTIALIIAFVILIAVSWDFFFDNFHAVFFEGLWQFSTSSTSSACSRNNSGSMPRSRSAC